MARFAERADPAALTAQEIVDQLGAYLAGRYQAAESYLVGEISRRVAADMNSDSPARRLEAIRALRTAAEEALAEIDGPAEARRIVDTATREGTAAAIEQLGFAQAATAGGNPPPMLNGQALPFATGLTPSGAIAAAQIGLELSNALEDVRQRILRSTTDAYQETIARFAGERLLGVTTGRQSRTRAVADFLGQGLTGFTDRAGRNWRIGSYVEMASRTATNRAWISAHVTRWQGLGINLVSIVRGVDSCRPCAEWSGRILSTDGTPAGTVTLEHATTGDPVTLTIAGTLDDARAGGWNHPNCRCTLAPVFPGLSLPADDSTYDPDQERERERLRLLERRVRDAKRKEQVALGMGDDLAAAEFRREIRAGQGAIRDHVANTRQLRKPYREALSFADGGPGSLPDPTPMPIVPDDPDDAPAWLRRHRAAADALPADRSSIGYRVREISVDEQIAAELVRSREIFLRGIDEDTLLRHADEIDDRVRKSDALFAEARTYSRLETRKTWPAELRTLVDDAGRGRDTPADFLANYGRERFDLDQAAGGFRLRVEQYREAVARAQAPGRFAVRTERLADLVDGDLGPDAARALDAVLDSGTAIDDEIRRRMAERGTPFTTSLDINAETERFLSAGLTPGTPEWEAGFARIKAAQAARDATEEVYGPIAREVLGEVREFGGGRRPKLTGQYGREPEVTEAMDQAFDKYPSAWNDRMTDGAPTVNASVGSRGYNDKGGSVIVLSGRNAEKLNSVATHEVGHSVERHVPGVTNLEWAFHYRRSDKVVGPNGVRTLAPAQRIGGGHGADEVTVPDDWALTYSGKVYRGSDQPEGSLWEVFTVGVQGVFHRDPYFARASGDDAEYRRFILGVLGSV